MQNKASHFAESVFERDRWLVLPVLLYLIFSVAYIFVIPVGESPDEPSHMRCIEQVAINGRLPVMETNLDESIDWRARRNILSDYMCYHMPLYYVISGLIVDVLADDDHLQYEYPAINEDYEEIPAMFVHDKRQTIWEHGQPLTMIVLRVGSLLLGLTVLGATFIVARRVFPEQRIVAFTAVTLLALWPQFIFMSRAITNDALATALVVIVLVLLLQIGHPYRFPIATLIASLAFLTKLSVTFALGVVFLVWLIEVWWVAREKRPYFYALFTSGVIVILLGFIVRMNPVLWANWQYSATDFSLGRSDILQPLYWQQVYVWTLSSGWAWFGWLSVRPSEIHARIWWLFIQIAVVLGSYLAIKRADSKQRKMVLVLCAIWASAIIVSYLRVTSNRWQPQFRFIFGILPLLTTFASAGIMLWAKQKSVQVSLLLGLTVVMALYNLWLIWAVILPAYQVV